ncbi:hypothetical protein AWV80_17520 [Cupriavidus sp. UYMU48A]|nr:hypothetical protein AWV80_17520 [Cupriavidus sp. UYMU48A]
MGILQTKVRMKPLIIGCLIILPILSIMSVRQNQENGRQTSNISAKTGSECRIPKRNGVLESRDCDLIELCADSRFYQKKLDDAPTNRERLDAMIALKKVENWLAEYRPEDVSNVCSGNYAPYQTGTAGAIAPAGADGVCSQSPTKLFPIGARFGNGEFTHQIDIFCPGAVGCLT